MLTLKFPRYLKKSKLLFYLQIIIFSTIPLLSIRYFRLNILKFSFPIFFIFVAFGILIFFILKKNLTDFKINKNSFYFIFLLFLFTIFQAINSYNNGIYLNSIDEVFKTFSSLIVFVFMLFLLNNSLTIHSNNIEKLFKSIIFISTIILIIFIVRYYFYFHSKYLGITFEYRTETGKNQLALFLGMLFPIVLTNFLNNKKVLTLLFFIVHAIALYYVDSRGVVVSLFLSYILAYIFFKNHFTLKIFFFYFILFIFVLLTYYIITNFSLLFTKVNNYNNINDLHFFKSDEMRTILAIKSLYFFISSPFIGIGTNAFFEKVGYLTHNSYLQILCEQGIMGFFLFILILILVYNNFRKIYIKGTKFQKSLVIGSLVPFIYLFFINAHNLILIYIYWSILFVINNNFQYEKK